MRGDDDFVRSILGDESPLMGARGGGGTRARANIDGAADQISYGTPTASALHYDIMPDQPATSARPRAVLANVTYSVSEGPTDPAGRDVDDDDLPFDIRFQREKIDAAAAAAAASRDMDGGDVDELEEGILFRDAEHAAEGLRTHKLFRYALLFINFTFVVAALLLIMAGVVARFNSALQLCNECGKLTLATIILGGTQWLLALFAFNWIRQRNILFLLGYVASVLAIAFATFIIFIAGIAFSFNLNRSQGSADFFQQWLTEVNGTDVNTGESSLCAIQMQYNCTGFQYGCCLASCTNITVAPDDWQVLVCPRCHALPQSLHVCTNVLTKSAAQNLGGFVVITFLAIVLAATGILLAAFSRQMNR